MPLPTVVYADPISVSVMEGLATWRNVRTAKHIVKAGSSAGQQNYCWECLSNNQNMHQIHFQLGLCSRPHWGSSWRSPRPPRHLVLNAFGALSSLPRVGSILLISKSWQLCALPKLRWEGLVAVVTYYLYMNCSVWNCFGLILLKDYQTYCHKLGNSI